MRRERIHLIALTALGVLIGGAVLDAWLMLEPTLFGSANRLGLHWLGPVLVLVSGLMISEGLAIRGHYRQRRALLEGTLETRTSALADERAFSEILLENTRDAFLVWNREGSIRHVSPSAERLFERTAGELVGHPLRSLIAGSHLAAYDRRILELRADRTPAHVLERPLTLYGLRPDGSSFPFEMVPYETTLGGRQVFAAMLRDVTERIAAERARQRSESLRAVMDALPDAVMVHRDGHLVYVNPQFLEALGYGRSDEVLDRALRDFIHPEDWSTVCARLHELAIRGKALEPAEERFCRRDGSTITLEVAKVPVVFDSSPAVATIGRDVSRRRLTERRLRQVVESAPSGMIMTDPEGRIVLVNDHVENLFGYPESELIGQQIETLIPARYRETYADLRQVCIRNPASRRMGVGLEFHALQKNGHEIPVEIILSPIQMDEGIYVLSSVVDVRERKKVETLIAMADRMAAVGTLAAGVAHGINNPLAYVKGNLQFARGELAKQLLPSDAVGPDSDAYEASSDLFRALDQAIEGADRIRDTVGDLLTYARHETQNVASGIDLHAVLESVTRMLSNELRHRAKLEKRYGDVPIVAGDSSRLAHAFTNLLVNAAHSIAEGHANENCIELSTTTDPETGFAVVEVRDTGVGISREVLPHVFEPFYTTKPVGAGVGLGLSVTQGIVGGLGGSIAIESEPGVGTRVVVMLPAAGTAQTPSRREDRSAAARATRILLVDDEPRVLEMLGRLLRSHEVTTASGAREALHRIESGERYDVIVCDLMMPETTGAQLHAALLAAHPAQAKRIVFMTGGAFTTDSRSFVEFTSNPVLQKPVDLEALEAAIAAVVDSTDGPRNEPDPA
jgi:PAS domain S-box-containing protein